MCTVSFIPTENGVFVTSNRDENTNRGNTISPLKYTVNGMSITYPKDEKGGGTWIGFNELNSVAVLLNGAFENHKHNPPYTHSRGIIIPEILAQQNSVLAAETFNCKGLEPFTLVLYSNGKLFEYRWDEKKMHQKQLDAKKIYVWNSSTLYTQEMEKKNLLELENVYNKNFTKSQIINFQLSKKYESQLPQNSKINNIKTISITQVFTANNQTSLDYYDLLTIQNKFH